MCGRYTLTAKNEELARQFLLNHLSEELGEDLEPRHNIAPSQSVLAIRASRDSGDRQAHPLRWGLVPFWAKDIRIGYRMINARSETASTKPAFRAAMKYRRCIIPASGFYEWQRRAETKRKQPYFFTHASESILGVAGLWETWKTPDGSALESCSILTTEANALMAPIHDRMPVVLREEDYEEWLDPRETNPGALQPLLQPSPSELMTRYPVSTMVNSPRNDGPELLLEIDLETGDFKEPPPGELFFKDNG